MEVKINREIRDYQESIFFGMNLRQLIFSLLAVAIAVSVYFGFRDALGTETVSWLCVLGACPFAALGFIRYNGMNAEQFVVAFIISEFLTPRTLLFKADNLYYTLLTTKTKQRKERWQKKKKKEAKLNV